MDIIECLERNKYINVWANKNISFFKNFYAYNIDQKKCLRFYANK